MTRRLGKSFLGRCTLASAAVLGTSGPVFATETTNYSYDTLGRLTQVAVASGPKSGSNTAYQLDPAGNRTNVTVTSSGTMVIVVPINGLTVIPIPAK